MKRNLFAIFLLFTIPGLADGQNIYGYTGLIKTPSAYTLENGKASVATQVYDDYYRSYNRDYVLIWSFSVNLGLLSRLEAGIRLVGYPQKFPGAFDRNLNLKLVLFKEKKWVPQIAIGFQDLVGTRLYNSSYLVVSKTLLAGKIVKLAASLGYGTKFTSWVYDEDAVDYRLQGFFGSVEAGVKNLVYGMVEYDGEDFNFGIRFQPFRFVSVTGFVNDYGYFGGMLRFAVFI